MFIVGPQYLVDLVVVDVAELFVQPLCCRGGCGFGVLGVELCRFPVVWHGQSLTDPVAPRQRTRIRCPRRLWRQALTSPGVDTSAYSHQEAITIDRPPEELYDLIADVSRMGRVEPRLHGRVVRRRRRVVHRHQRHGRLDLGDPVPGRRGRAWARVRLHQPRTRRSTSRWSAGASLCPAVGGGTDVTQTWEVLPDYADGLGADEAGAVAVLDMMKDAALQEMPQTLDALKAGAEADA